MSARLLAFAGSTRTGSFNKMLIRVAAEGAREAGAEVKLIDLRDLPMPLYDGDLEESEGLPEHAVALKKLFLSHDGLLLSCPEYNASMTGVFKNAIDWVSRPAPGEKTLECFKGKTCALLAASPGALGGLRGLVHVRALMSHLGMIVLPEQVAVMKAHEAFDADGKLKDAKQEASVKAIAASLARLTAKIAG